MGADMEELENLDESEIRARGLSAKRSTLTREQPVRSADTRGDLQGTSDKSQPHHVEPRRQLFVPKEDTFPIPLTHIDVTRSTHTNLDALQESRIGD